MCLRKRTDINGKADDWSLEQLEHVLNEINVEDKIVAQIGGNNEPLLYKHFRDGLNLILSKGYDTVFTTNGSLLGKEINYLPQCIPIFVSIDGGTEEDYKAIRGQALTPVLDNVTDLRIRRPDIPVTLHCIMLKGKVLGYRNLADFCKRYDIGMQFWYPIFFDNEYEKKYSLFYKDDYSEDVVMLYDYCNSTGLRKELSSFKTRERICPAPLTSPFIAKNGDVYPCCIIAGNRETDPSKQIWHTYYQGREITVPQYQYHMGNIFNDSFKDMWNSDKWVKLKRHMIGLANMYDKRERYNKDPYGRYIRLIESYDPNREFTFCDVCPYRWSRSV